MNWCPCSKTFPPFNSTESRRNKFCQKDPACHQNDTCSGWIHFVHLVTTLCQKKEEEEERKKAKENTFCVSYTVLLLTFNILRLSAMSQMGHKLMFWRPALLPSPESMQYKPQVTVTHTHTHTQIYIYVCVCVCVSP